MVEYRDYIFHREDSCFDDILKDPAFRRKIRRTLAWPKHVWISLAITGRKVNQLESYILLKYGHDLINMNVPDRTPVMFKDYIPEPPRRPKEPK